jgi:hypothetical protein
MKQEEGVGSGLAWVAVFLLVASLLHLLIPAFFDSDTAYHLAVARLTREHGILHAFPWTPYSWLAEHYADKEFFFHLLLLPLAPLHPATASTIAGTFLGTALMTVLFLILRAEKVSRAGLWTLLTLVISGAYIARFAMVRPHLLSILLSLLLVWSAVRRRWFSIAAAAFLFPLGYTAWHLPLALVLVVIATESVSGRKIDWRVPALVAAAGLLGVLSHPNFPETVRLFWIQNFEILFKTAWAGRAGIDLGGEFRPFSLFGLGRYVLLPAALVLWSLKAAWKVRRENVLPLAAASCALLFLGLTIRTQRFIEYLVPFAVMGAALTRRADRQRFLPAVSLPQAFSIPLCSADTPSISCEPARIFFRHRCRRPSRGLFRRGPR